MAAYKVHLTLSGPGTMTMMMMVVCGQGVSLAQAKDKGQLIFLEGLKDSLSVLIPQESSRASEAMDFLRYPQTSAVLSWGLFPLHHWNHSFRGLLLFVCLQGSRCWLEEPVRVCSVQPEQRCRRRPGGRCGGGVGTSGDAGGRHQRAAESGGQRRSCAGLQPLLSSHRLLTAEGESVTSRQ